MNDRGLDPGGFDDSFYLFQIDIGYSDGLALAFIHQFFQGPPCIEQGHCFVVNHVAVGIARVLVIAGLEGEGGVDEIEIEEVELEFLEAGLEGGLDAFGAMVGVPELGDDEDVLPFDRSGFDHLAQPLRRLGFRCGSVRRCRLCGIRLPCRRLGCVSGCRGVRNERAKAQLRAWRAEALLRGILL